MPWTTIRYNIYEACQALLVLFQFSFKLSSAPRMTRLLRANAPALHIYIFFASCKSLRSTQLDCLSTSERLCSLELYCGAFLTLCACSLTFVLYLFRFLSKYFLRNKHYRYNMWYDSCNDSNSTRHTS